MSGVGWAEGRGESVGQYVQLGSNETDKVLKWHVFGGLPAGVCTLLPLRLGGGNAGFCRCSLARRAWGRNNGRVVLGVEYREASGFTDFFLVGAGVLDVCCWQAAPGPSTDLTVAATEGRDTAVDTAVAVECR